MTIGLPAGMAPPARVRGRVDLGSLVKRVSELSGYAITSRGLSHAILNALAIEVNGALAEIAADLARPTTAGTGGTSNGTVASAPIFVGVGGGGGSAAPSPKQWRCPAGDCPSTRVITGGSKPTCYVCGNQMVAS